MKRYEQTIFFNCGTLHKSEWTNGGSRNDHGLACIKIQNMINYDKSFTGLATVPYIKP
jgi:hypothetical protein